MKKFYNVEKNDFVPGFLKLIIPALFSLFITNKVVADYTVASGTSVNASTITGQSGVLTINGTLHVNQSTVNLLGFTSVVINGPNGQIYWDGNNDLYFSAGISFVINNPALGLQPTAGNGNASTRLIIGATVIAVSSDNSNNAAFSFEDFNAAGGLPQFTLTTPASTICYNGTFTATITPLITSINYDCKWSVDNGGSISPATVANFHTPQTATITPTNSTTAKTYTISCTLYATGDGDPIITKTVTVTVNPVPAAPTSVTASPSSVCAGSISNIKATSSGNTIQWYTVSTAGSSIGSSASAVNFSVSPASATTYYAEAKNGTGCTSTSRNPVTVTVSPASVAGNISGAASVCSGTNSTVLILSGNTGSIQWQSSTDNVTFGNIPGATSSTYTATNLVSATYYKVVVTSGTCASASSSIAKAGLHNVWIGVTSTDWQTASNWSDGSLPSLACPDVTIPASTPYSPILAAGTATITNLVINSTLTVNNTGILQIAGTVTNNGIFDVTNGTLELNGTGGTQNTDGSLFNKRTVKNLIISNNVNVSNTLNDTLNISGTLSFGNTTAILNSGDNITLKSSALATANVGVLAPGNNITGNVTVERYIGTGTYHAKSWQFLAVPTVGQTIKQAWQEGATATNVSSPGAGTPGNPVAGYGTMITSNVANAATQSAPGFDAYTSGGPTIKVYNSLTGNYDGPASTALPIYNQKGYLVFIRGDRSVNGAFMPANPTILRTKGALFTPANPAPTTTVIAGKFTSIGNPFASALDMRNITLGGGTNEFFYVWDPMLGSQNGYGAFQTFSKIGNDYYVTPGGGSYGSTGIPGNYIQSGQAFLVQATGSNGTVSFTESAKANSSTLFTTPNPVNQVQHILRTSLNTINADGTTGSIVDGILSQFDDAYSNDVDAMDGRKSVNSGENLSVKTGGKLLVIERKHTITAQDTIFLNLTGASAKPYRFHFDAENLDPSVQGFLADNYLGIRTPLDMTGSTDVSFTVANVTGSNAANRFMIVFAPFKALPVTFTSVKAWQHDKNINVEWTVDNEVSIKQYEVEKSINGNDFTTIAIKPATAGNGLSSVYDITDANPVEGYNYYRVKSVDVNGKKGYTNVVKVLMGTIKQDITIYPNPITDGAIHLQLINQPAGAYQIRLINKPGQEMLSKKINHTEGSSTELIKWDSNLAHGVYQLEVTGPGTISTTISVIY